MSLQLGPLFAFPMHAKPWCSYGTLRGKTPDCPRLDYRITAGFLDRDILNGGLHRAIDTGNASTEHPVLSPCSAPMRHLQHFDGARGREWELGGGWSLETWHLHPHPEDPQKPDSGTARGPWQQVERGQTVGLTGSTGRDLPDGSPMPPHTHIVLIRSGVAVDPEPYLHLNNAPGLRIQGATDDMATFTDVPEDHPFYHDIEWMAEKGITKGIPNRDGSLRFEPDRPVTRAEMSAFLHRLYSVVLQDVD